jgi:acetoin utilization deacetylase AcuC-like enzyme/GNAT superfamily N-acetyltransferase
MFQIRRIYDTVLRDNHLAIEQAKEIIREHFGQILSPSEVRDLDRRLRDPFSDAFNAVVFVAQDSRQQVLGIAMVLHDPHLRFCLLHLLAARPGGSGAGIGGALYQRVREVAAAWGAKGLFMECYTDEPNPAVDEEELKANRARLRFYERYGARPIESIDYESTTVSEDPCPYVLVYDGLNRKSPPRRRYVRRVVRALFERCYAHQFDRGRITYLVRSVDEDPVRLRRPRYRSRGEVPAMLPAGPDRVALVACSHPAQGYSARGYLESPANAEKISAQLEDSPLFEPLDPATFSDEPIRAVHDPKMVDYLRQLCRSLESEKTYYAYMFPAGPAPTGRLDALFQAGWFCGDSVTPLRRETYASARRAVDCALSGARAIAEGQRLAYSLTSPPGHLATRDTMQGCCYFNSAAVAAQYLTSLGKVAVLDIDYHHGWGTQEIFYDRPDVLTVSIHADPDRAYPYFSGRSDQTGRGPGEGANWNVPLGLDASAQQWRRALDGACRRIESFQAQALVVSLGLDIARGDPLGSWSLRANDFRQAGRRIAELSTPSLFVQEGAYATRQVVSNLKSFFAGLTGARRRRPSRTLGPGQGQEAQQGGPCRESD